MNIFKSTITVVFVGLLLVGVRITPVVAQDSHACGPLCHIPANTKDASSFRDSFKAMKERLKIMPKQMNAWDNYVWAARRRMEAALDGETLVVTPVKSDQEFDGSTLAPVNSAAVIAQSESLAAAFKELYAVLDLRQKALIDARSKGCRPLVKRFIAAESRLKLAAFDAELLVQHEIPKTPDDVDGATLEAKKSLLTSYDNLEEDLKLYSALRTLHCVKDMRRWITGESVLPV